MIIIPAIDIIDNKVVRLTKGDYNSTTNYNITVVEQAKIYVEQGFEWIHLVDLSGSKYGKINVLKTLEDIKKETNLNIEFGGGIRDKEDILKLLKINVDKVIIGSMSVNNKKELLSALKEVDPDSIIIAADVLNYKIRIKGWTENSGINLYDHIEFCNSLGLKNFLCTDIAVDGMLTGPNINLYKNILERFPEINLIASGGISSMNDIYQLSNFPIHSAVVGKAIYENKIKIEELSNFAK